MEVWCQVEHEGVRYVDCSMRFVRRWYASAFMIHFGTYKMDFTEELFVEERANTEGVVRGVGIEHTKNGQILDSTRVKQT